MLRFLKQVFIVVDGQRVTHVQTCIDIRSRVSRPLIDKIETFHAMGRTVARTVARTVDQICNLVASMVLQAVAADLVDHDRAISQRVLVLHSVVVGLDSIEQVEHELVTLLLGLGFFVGDTPGWLGLISFAIVDIWIQLGRYFCHQTSHIIDIKLSLLLATWVVALWFGDESLLMYHLAWFRWDDGRCDIWHSQ